VDNNRRGLSSLIKGKEKQKIRRESYLLVKDILFPGEKILYLN
jgi:hypothetical protein